MAVIGKSSHPQPDGIPECGGILAATTSPTIYALSRAPGRHVNTDGCAALQRVLGCLDKTARSASSQSLRGFGLALKCERCDCASCSLRVASRWARLVQPHARPSNSD